jgi:hypothetical protein
MDYIFGKCTGKSSALLSPSEIQEHLAPRDELTFKQIELTVKNLMVDGFIDVYHSDNKGVTNYVISLKTRGEAYEREKKDARDKRIRAIGWRIFLAILGSVAVFIFWQIIGNN